MACYHTRSKARRSGDVEPDDVAPVATSDLTLDSTVVGPSAVAAGESGYMATESAGPVFVPLPLFQREGFPPRGRTLYTRACGFYSSGDYPEIP